ncbi:MAG: MMPL family transporter [Deltaproteobacteria bacterium]|nr:MMPL family transporter [Deltaproteobacteria bacterium]
MFWTKLARFQEKYYGFVITGAIVLSVVSFFAVKTFKIDTNLAALLPEEHPSVKGLNRVIDKLGGLGNFIVLVENESLEAKKEFVKSAATVIESNPLIRYVDVEYEKNYFQDHLLLYIDLQDLKTIRKRLKEKIDFEKKSSNPFFVNIFEKEVDLTFEDLEKKYERRFGVKKGFKKRASAESYFLDPENQTIAFIVKPRGSEADVGSAKEIYAYLQKALEKLNSEQFGGKFQFEIAGPYRYKVDEYRTVVRDIKSTGFFAVLGIVLILTLLFRQYVAVFFIAIPLFIGVLWTFALVSLHIQTLNLITAFLFAVLFGLGVEYGIHMLHRYLECRHDGKSIHDSLVTILTHTGRASLTSAASTAVAFYSLMITDFKGFSELGFIAGTGVLITLFSIYIVFPPLLILCEKWKLIRYRKQNTQRTPKAALPFAKIIFIAGIAITILSVLTIPKIELEYDFTNLRANLKETQPLRDKIGTIFTRSQSPAVVITENYEEALGVIQAVENIIETDKETPTIDSVLSIPSIYPPDQDEKLEEIQKLRVLLADKALQRVKDKTVKEHLDDFRKAADIKEKVVYEKVPKNLVRQFEGVDGTPGYFVFIFPSVQLRDGREAIRFADDIRVISADIKKNGESFKKNFYPSSDSIVFADMLSIMVKDGKKSVLICLFVVFLCLLADFRSFRSSLLIILPLLCGLLWMSLAMFIGGLKLNFFNIVVIPSLIGVVIDGGVHIMHRYKEEGLGSLRRVVILTSIPIFLTASTTIIGYGGLLSAFHPGLRSLGTLAILGVTTCFITSVTLLPALLQILENRRLSSPDP